jgi:hypothetical protein
LAERGDGSDTVSFSVVYSVALHGLRRSFSSLAEWTEIPCSIKAQIMGHKPSAIAERHYNVRPLEGRLWEIRMTGCDGIARAIYVTGTG